MQELMAERKRNVIKFTNGTSKTFDSITKAKHESRKIQQANGGLGRGAVKVLVK